MRSVVSVAFLVWSGESFFKEIEPFKLRRVFDIAQRLLDLDAWHYGECRAARVINCLPRCFDKLLVQAIFFLHAYVLSIEYCEQSRLGGTDIDAEFRDEYIARG